ncbi:unnamed protein product [Arctia plantaginis]|uniref:Uncharacterized protein n=1 Tax=Arctia plantaginis TaxID=874455 RepID=A0A8S0Z7K8_ARCPL|nr:unnamed protein product [Arctia plantaginis]
MVMELKNWCFCGSLRAGSLVIGYFNLIRDLLMIGTLTILLLIPYSSDFALSNVDRAINYMLIGIGIINLIFVMNISKFIKIYLVYSLTAIVIASLLMIILYFTIEVPFLIYAYLIHFPFHIYNIIIIRSYYLVKCQNGHSSLPTRHPTPLVVNQPENDTTDTSERGRCAADALYSRVIYSRTARGHPVAEAFWN